VSGRALRGAAARAVPAGPLAGLVLAAALLAPVGLAAQDAANHAPARPPDASTPEAATLSLVESIRAADYERMADLMHPDALEELRRLFEPILEAPEMADFRQEIFGVSSTDSATALSGRAIYETIISFALGSDPATAAAMQSVRAEVVGHVAEGDTAHVVYRMNMNVEGFELAQTAVASFREHEGRWLGLLTADIRGMIAGLRQALEQQREAPGGP